MKERTDILAHAARLRQEGVPAVLATVVEIGGSTYRRPGARMLVDGVGNRWGTLSGGCLEGEVARQALDVLATGRPRLLPFDLSDDDLILGFGTGCNGAVHVLLEPVPPGRASDPIDLLGACFAARRQGVLATVVEAGSALEACPGDRLLLLDDGAVRGGLAAASPLYRPVLAAACHDLEAARSQARRARWEVRRYHVGDARAAVLFEAVRPPVRLVVFGEGHDVPPVVALARQMGWQPTVVGRKPADVLAARFPDAAGWTFLMHPAEVLDHVALDAWTAALVMNHTYVRDRDLVRVLLRTDVPYVGVLGPRERTERMVGELHAAGEPLAEAQLARLFGPVGLDLGTEAPEEIALAAVAEIQAVLHGRPGGSLRVRTEPIHGARVTPAKT